MTRKIISTMVIISGLLLLAYPKLSERYEQYQQQCLINAWQQSFSQLEAAEADTQDEVTEDTEETEKKMQQEAQRQREEYIKQNMEGMLKIEKINLYLPILHGATEKNLLISVATIQPTGQAGQVGNYAIAGHRNQTYGRNFNRLDEVALGDMIKVETGAAWYKYTVTEKLYVKPNEVWVLNSNHIAKEITLVTCHPMNKPTHRLIIKGKMID